jgi:predicted kinase
VFARALAEAVGAFHLNSDATRTTLGLRGHYSPADKEKVYAEMFDRARQALADHRSVVVDATFFRHDLRQPWLDLARSLRIPCRWFLITAPEDTILERLRSPRPDSEATAAVYASLKARWEPLDPPFLSLDSSTVPLSDMVALAIDWLRKSGYIPVTTNPAHPE